MIGRTLAHYRITAKLGEGGMGEVYLAEDTKLGREVAIKVLPAGLAYDPARLARLEREAKTLAALNHPNVATLYGFEAEGADHFLVMEMVEGEDLARRLQRGPIPLEEALPLLLQIAEGFEAAHQKGIIHRDLKPANVMVSDDARVKILDFGLAKVIGHDVPAIDLSQSPTLTAGPTGAGVLLGTAPYMSPEQARGQEVDKRADIWAFGCLLYEMLTGKRPFCGETVSDVLVAVLGEEPDWSTLPAGIPVKIRDLLRRCLRKKSRDRLHDIADARLEIEEALAEPLTGELVAEEEDRTSIRRYKLVIAALTVIAALAVALAVKSWIGLEGSSPTRQTPTRFVITLPPGQDFVGNLPFALSRDGRSLAYSAAEKGKPSRIYIRSLDQFEARPLAGTEGGEVPFFSPNGQWVGFFGAEGILEKVAIAGGPVRKIRGFATSPKYAASWGEDGNIVFVAGITAGLERVSAEGGEPQKLTIPQVTKGEIGHWYPSVLPGNQGVLFSVWSVEGYSVALLSQMSGKRKPLLPGGNAARATASGYLVYLESRALLAVPFDLKSGEVQGSPIPLLEGIAEFDISDSDALIYRESTKGAQLVSICRSGERRALDGEAGIYHHPRFSPDGRRLAVAVSPVLQSDIWVIDLERGSQVRLTSEGAVNNGPVWSPDGTRIAFNSARALPGIYSMASDGSGLPKLLLKREGPPRLPSSWAPDGRWIAFVELNRDTGADIWLLDAGDSGSSMPYLVSPFEEHSPKFSPDGRWMAYVSNESGREEVYVQPAARPGTKWTISTAGGTEPVWSRDGEELYYRSAAGMTVVSVDSGQGFEPGRPRVMFDDTFHSAIGGVANYDVAPEGDRLLMVQAIQEDSGPAQLKVVLNWAEELKRLASER